MEAGAPPHGGALISSNPSPTTSSAAAAAPPDGPASEQQAPAGSVSGAGSSGSRSPEPPLRRPSLGLARRYSSAHYWLQDSSDPRDPSTGGPTSDRIAAGATAALDAAAAAATAAAPGPPPPPPPPHLVRRRGSASADNSDHDADSSASSGGGGGGGGGSDGGQDLLRQGLLRHAHHHAGGSSSSSRRRGRTWGGGRHKSPLAGSLVGGAAAAGGGGGGASQPRHLQQRRGAGLLGGLFGGRQAGPADAVPEEEGEEGEGAAFTPASAGQAGDAAIDIIDPAAVDLIGGAGSLTFAAATSPRRRAAAAGAGAAATTAAAAVPAAPGTAPVTGDGPAAPAAAAAAAGPGACSHFNDQVFSGAFDLPGGGGGGGGIEAEAAEGRAEGARRPHSVTLGQLSRNKMRWQAAAQKVISMRHLTSSFRPGALQGLDVKRHSYDSIFASLHTEVKITVADYSAEQVEVASAIGNATLPEFLKVARPPWSKVRWINVQGLSWDVITTLAVAFDLHPLSVEDVVHIPQRIKADYYPHYLYASVILLSVDHPSQLAEQAPGEGFGSSALHHHHHHDHGGTAAGTKQQQGLGSGSRSGSVAGAPHDASRGGGGGGIGGRAGRLRTRLFGGGGAKAGRTRRLWHEGGGASLLQPMSPVVEQASIFLFRDGTLITMFQSVEADDIARRLLSKLEGFRSILTDSEDASYLFNAVLDAVVDHTLPLVQVYSARIAALESAVLLDARPEASLTKELHLLSNDLKLLRRTLVPTQHLIHKLQTSHADKEHSQGFLSPLTVLYLSDVYDHISTVVEDMESLAEDAKDLIDLIFNTIAHNNNASMQILSIVSTLFLPITFLAGVYGTNFEFFPEIHLRWGYVYFWVACTVITIVFAALLQRWGMFESTGASGIRRQSHNNDNGDAARAKLA